MATGRPAWAVRLQAERERRHWGKRRMARELIAAKGRHASEESLAHQIGDWENGKHFPRDWAAAYAAAFTMPEEDLFSEDREGSTGSVEGSRPTNRRSSPKLEMTATAAPQVQHRIIQALEVLDSDHVGGLAACLGDLVDHYALTICSLPPAEVYDELLAVRSYASTVIRRLRPGARGEGLSLTIGWLSHLLSVAACDMGEHAVARLWCCDAERRSRDAGHPELTAWSTLTRAMIAFYQGHSRHSMLLSAQGQRTAPSRSAVRAKLASQEMRAAAMAGDADRMVNARRQAAKVIAALPAVVTVTGAFAIALAEDPPYTATSLLFLGRFQEAVSATDRVIGTVYRPESWQRGEHPSGYARALLILGLAQAGAGRLDEAVAAGQAALNGSRPAWPTMVLAGKLDHVLARDFSGADEAAIYHARYREAASVPAPAATATIRVRRGS